MGQKFLVLVFIGVIKVSVHILYYSGGTTNDEHRFKYRIFALADFEKSDILGHSRTSNPNGELKTRVGGADRTSVFARSDRRTTAVLCDPAFRFSFKRTAVKCSTGFARIKHRTRRGSPVRRVSCDHATFAPRNTAKRCKTCIPFGTACDIINLILTCALDFGLP